jgi:hypothetical protein
MALRGRWPIEPSGRRPASTRRRDLHIVSLILSPLATVSRGRVPRGRLDDVPRRPAARSRPRRRPRQGLLGRGTGGSVEA